MKKFFIVGCPRSGTTVLQQALNRHSQIVIPPETKYFFSFLGHSHSQQLRHLPRLNSDLGVELAPPARRIHSILGARAFFDDMAQQYVHRLRRMGITWFGEKTPEHTSRIQRIRAVFPNAKIIFLYRDGRDVALSLTKVPWMHGNLYVNFMIWLYYYRVLARERSRAGKNLLFVRYEDFVAEPAAELRRLMRFLELGYEPAMATGNGNREGIPEREYEWKARALEPITRSRVGLWRSELSIVEIEALERLGSRALGSLGYELRTSGNAKLSLQFYSSLSLNFVGLLARLPVRALLEEIVSI